MRSLKETLKLVMREAALLWEWIKFTWILITSAIGFAVVVIALLATTSGKPQPRITYNPIITHEAAVVRGTTWEQGDGVYKAAPGSIIVPPTMWEVPVSE